MQGFVVRANIERFRERLATTEDAQTRAAIEQLLAEEIAKLSPQDQDAFHAPHAQSGPPGD